MATKRRDIALGKEKAKSPSQTAPTKLKPTLNQPTKPNVSTASQKQAPAYLRPTTRATPTLVSKPLAKKPASIDPGKPASPRPKPVDKPLSPAQKARVSTNASPRSSPLSGKIVESRKLVSGKILNSQKPVPGKNLKTPTKEVEKQHKLHAAPVSSVKKSSLNMAKKEIRSGSSAKKEQITCTPYDKIENPSMPIVLEAETQAQNPESSYIAEGEEKMQVDEKGSNDLVQEYQEPLDTKSSEAEIDQTDAQIVTSESSTVPESEETPLNIKRQDSEGLEEQGVDDTHSCNKGDGVVEDNFHEDTVEEEQEEVAKEQEMALRKTEVAENRSEAKETEGKEVENVARKQVERAHGKRDSPVSNDVIEETASKLREQRKNKVKALAGAFETVISLQETK